VETLFKEIQYCADLSKTGGVEIIHYHQINVRHANIFASGNFMSSCRRWNEKETAVRTWVNVKAHFSAARRQHKQVQGESAANSGHHVAKADIGQTEDKMAESTIGTLSNLETSTATDLGVVETLTETNALGQTL
jgi:hypothetical protein